MTPRGIDIGSSQSEGHDERSLKEVLGMLANVRISLYAIFEENNEELSRHTWMTCDYWVQQRIYAFAGVSSEQRR